jgi:hypothetical protein
MDNNNVDDNGNCFLNNVWYAINNIDDNRDDINNEVDAQIIINRGWISEGPYTTHDMCVLEILGGLEQWFCPGTRGKLQGQCNMHTADYIQYYTKDLVVHNIILISCTVLLSHNCQCNT